jgi:hypothetical protein
MDECEAFKILGTFPHCDHRLLHSPGNCTYCDAHPEWQALRIVLGINFTGETDPEKLPCPGAMTRSAERAHQWGGNRPQAEPPQPPSVYDHIRGSFNRDE